MKNGYSKLYIPKYLREGGLLVGAAQGDLTHEQLLDLRNKDSDTRTLGPIYPDLELVFDPQQIENALGRREEDWKVFMPPCGADQLGFDCAAKTINMLLGFQFFTQREQIVRLINLHVMNKEKSKKQKAMGGVLMHQLEDFAINGDEALSF